MSQAFIIVLREGFESFLIVAIILSYLNKVGHTRLIPAVYWGIFISLFASAGMGFIILQTANGPFWEGVFGLVGATLVATFVLHMWRTASHLKKDVESRLRETTAGKTNLWAFFGVFLFTVLMITREGMETAFLLIQIHDPQVVTGAFLGMAAAIGMCSLWARFGHLINLKLFFQVTSIFLLLFVLQILIYSFHEFTEAGLLPHSEALHLATEPFSPDGIYGRWVTPLMIGVCAIWLIGAWLHNRLSRKQATSSR